MRKLGERAEIESWLQLCGLGQSNIIPRLFPSLSKRDNTSANLTGLWINCNNIYKYSALGLTNSKSAIIVSYYYYRYSLSEGRSGKLAFMTASMCQVPGEVLSMRYPT